MYVAVLSAPPTTRTTTGPAAPKGGTDLRMGTTPIGQRRFLWFAGKLFQRSMVNPGMEWEVVQVKDTITPGHPRYNAKSHLAKTVRFEDGRLEIALERHAQRGLVSDLSRKLEQWTNRRWTVVVSNETGQPTVREQNLAAKGERERAAESDPRVREVLARFPGAKLVEVRKLAAEPPESDVSPAGLDDGFAGDEAPDDRDNDF